MLHLFSLEKKVCSQKSGNINPKIIYKSFLKKKGERETKWLRQKGKLNVHQNEVALGYQLGAPYRSNVCKGGGGYIIILPSTSN